jgi:hypothetical protein
MAFLNKDYMTELRRRAAIIGDRFLTDQANPDKMSDQNFSPFLYQQAAEKLRCIGLS